MKRVPASKDYSNVFLAAILIGIVMVVLGVMMAVAHSMSRANGYGKAVIKPPVAALSHPAPPGTIKKH